MGLNWIAARWQYLGGFVTRIFKVLLQDLCEICMTYSSSLGELCTFRNKHNSLRNTIALITSFCAYQWHVRKHDLYKLTSNPEDINHPFWALNHRTGSCMHVHHLIAMYFLTASWMWTLIPLKRRRNLFWTLLESKYHFVDYPRPCDVVHPWGKLGKDMSWVLGLSECSGRHPGMFSDKTKWLTNIAIMFWEFLSHGTCTHLVIVLTWLPQVATLPHNVVLTLFAPFRIYSSSALSVVLQSDWGASIIKLGGSSK